MSEDAKFLLETFKRQYSAIKDTLTSRRRHIDDFDRLSFHAWAIGEVVKIIEDCTMYISVHEIRCILDESYVMYMGFYDENPKQHLKFKHAADAVKKLYKLTEGFTC